MEANNITMRSEKIRIIHPPRWGMVKEKILKSILKDRIADDSIYLNLEDTKSRSESIMVLSLFFVFIRKLMKERYAKGMKVCCWTIIFIFALNGTVRGQTRSWIEMNISPSYTMTTVTAQSQWYIYKISQNGTYTLKNMSQGLIVLTNSNLKVTINVEGTNILTANIDGTRYDNAICYAGLDLDNFYNTKNISNITYNTNNTVILKAEKDKIASIEATGAAKTNVGKIAGIKFLKQYGNKSVNNNLEIDGPIMIKAIGATAENHHILGLGGQSYMENCPGGTLTLRNGACVYEKGVLGTGNVSENVWYPTVKVDNYATYDQEELSITAAKNPNINATLETLVYKASLTAPAKDTRVTVSPNGRGGAGVYQIYANTKDNKVSFYRSSTSTSGDWSSNATWDYIKVGDIPSGTYNTSTSSRNMGAFYDQSNTYFESLVGEFSNTSLTLNTNNYTYNGILEAKNVAEQTFIGNNNTLKSNILTFKGTVPLKLSNVKIDGTVKIDGKVYVDPSNLGNLTSWSTQNTSGNAIRYCVATLPDNADVSSVKVGTTSITNYYQNGTTLYFWTQQSSSEQTFTVSTSTSEYITKATPQNQNTQISFALIVAKIGTTPYTSLAGAFNAVRKGNAIQLEQNCTVPSNTILTLPSVVTSNELVTLNLNGKTLTGSPGSGFNGANGVLMIKNDTGNGALSGSFSISGCLYTDLSNISASFTDASSGDSRYRVKVKNLPTKAGTSLTYSGGGSLTKAYYDSTYGACLWLPGTGDATSFSIYENGEQFARIDKKVETNHNNEETNPYPYVDIQYGSITITPQVSEKQKVVYGSKSYEASVDSKSNSRLPIYGTATGGGKNNTITIINGSANKAFLTLSGVNIHPQLKAALIVNGNADIELSDMNYLHGGANGSTTYPAVSVAANTTLDWNNSKEGDGYLSVVGGFSGMNTSPAIKVESSSTMIIKNGTYSILRSKGDVDATLAPENSIDGGTQYIYAGSVNAGYVDASRPKNQGGQTIYKTTISTNQKKWEVYRCEYTGSYTESGVSSLAMPDDALKFYCWMKSHKVDEPHSKVEFWDKANNPINPSVEVPEVGTHDQNAAPVAVTLIDQKGGKPNVSFGTLQEAFLSMAQGGDYRLLVLINIYGLSTVQKIPENTKVAMDMQGFTIGHDATALYDAANSGAYLYIHNGGDMENQFQVDGDVFIAGNVPLTHATVRKNGLAVYRTLISGLREDDKHQYSFYNHQDISFKLHDGLACLWLPYGQDEVRIKEGGGPEPIEYTTGVITTGIHQPDVTPARTVGTVAVMTGTDKDGKTVNKSYKNLKQAFDDAFTLAGTDAEKLVIQLLAGVSFSSTQSVSGAFTLDLNGKNLSAPSGAGKLEIASGTDIRIVDRSAGMKGKLQTDMDLDGNAILFVSGAIQIEGTVKKKGENDVLWRTLVDLSYQDEGLKTVTYRSLTYPVVERSLCLWLPDGGPNDYKFTIVGKEETVKNQTISKNHTNDMTIGGGDFAARTGGQTYEKVESAFGAVTEDQTVELLKTSPLTSATALIVSSTLELGKYGLVANQASGAATLTVKDNVQFTVRSTVGSGQISTPIILADNGLLYIGADVQQIGQVNNSASSPLYRLLVNQLPNSIPDGVHEYTYNNGTKGKCLVRNHTACLWLPKSDPKDLTFSLNGTDYTTKNVGVRENHANTQTYGVNEVAEVWGFKYSTLSEAFQNAAGGTVLLLKDASVDAEISVSGNVILDMAGFSITSSEPKNLFNVGTGNNLQVIGRGSIAANFNIKSVLAGTMYSNANLQVASEVYLGSSTVILNDPVYRVIVNGDYPINMELVYSYTNKQDGQVKSSISSKPLCLWMKSENTPNSFFLMQGERTWQAPSVVVVATHANVLTVTPVEAVAGIGMNDVYATIVEALKVANNGEIVKLLHNVLALSGEHKLSASSGTIVFDLQKQKIDSKDASFATAGATLIIENGSLTGNIKLTETDKIFMKGSLQMGNTFVTDKNEHTLWRTLLTLPAGTASFSYKLGNATGTSTNIQTIGSNPVACLWLPSSNQAQDLIVTIGGTEYALKNTIITSTHGNELDLTNTDPVASDGINNYASLASAFAVVADNGMVTLLKDLVLSSVQSVGDKNVTLNLGTKSITSANSGFLVGGTGKKLTITNGILSGTFRISGDLNTVAIEKGVSLSGTVLDRDNKAVYRGLIKVGPDVNATIASHWLYPNSRIYDYTFISSGDTYEATIPANFTDHNTKLTAYKQITLAGDSENWEAVYANTNLVLESNVVLTAQTTATLHRLTLHDGAKVKTTPGTNVIATEGIHYKRSFTMADTWESIALPFTATRIEMINKSDKANVTSLSPATGSGTAGYFWLTTVDNDGSLKDVTSSEMTANEAYLMAVPSNLQNQEITFVSGENQLLNRNARPGVQPVSGFASYANETLDDLALTTACYVLDDSGQNFVRIQSSSYQKTFIPPFRGYLFADPVTTAVISVLRAGSVPTSTVTPLIDSNLRIAGGRGCVILEAESAHLIAIYSFSGRCIRAFSFAGGRMEVELAGGFYVVNGKKIFVK